MSSKTRVVSRRTFLSSGAAASDMEYTAGSDEFGSIRFNAPPSREYQIGDMLELIVPHCDPVVNLYDQMYGIRKNRVEVIWPVTARGKSQ